jgi:beta-galactosidase
MAPKRDLSHLNYFLYGGDYNPEQWPEEVWQEDMALMKEAGVNMVSIAIFSWAKLEPREGEFDFGWLDRMMDLLAANGINADLATATAAPPPWLAHKYPDSLPMTKDGITLFPGSRQQYDPHSVAYRELGSRLVTRLAERYKSHPALAMWHINNEYGCHVSESFTPAATAAWRKWLQARYGTIERLNDAWGTAFWSQRYDDWAEINAPRTAPTFINPTQQLDWRRFSNDSILDLMKMEVDILRKITPDVPVVTNFMGFFKPLDYWEWAKHEDVVSTDNYPDPMEAFSPIYSAMHYDLMRSLRQGQPWVLMEQTPSAVNWRERNALKKPNQMRLWSYQALSRAANGILFFQWRAAKAGAEKFHGAMVPHAGKDTRIYREVKQLGQELQALSQTGLQSTTNQAGAAMVFDWENWWVLEQDSHPTRDLNVFKIAPYYAALHQQNIETDFIQSTADLNTLMKYKLIVIPNLYLTRPGVAERFEQFVAAGGTLVVGPFSGISNEDDHIWLGGAPGPFKTLLGIHIEEYEAMAQPNFVITDDEESFACDTWRDNIALRGAKMVARFGQDYYADAPSMTQNDVGKGRAYYVGTCPDIAGLTWLLKRACSDAGLKPALDVPAGVEVLVRSNGAQSFTFLLNHGDKAVDVRLPAPMRDVLSGESLEGKVTLGKHDARVLTHQ